MRASAGALCAALLWALLCAPRRARAQLGVEHSSAVDDVAHVAHGGAAVGTAVGCGPAAARGAVPARPRVGPLCGASGAAVAGGGANGHHVVVAAQDADALTVVDVYRPNEPVIVGHITDSVALRQATAVGMLDQYTAVVAARGSFPNADGAVSVVSIAAELWGGGEVDDTPGGTQGYTTSGRMRVQPVLLGSVRDCTVGYKDWDETRFFGTLCGARAIEIDQPMAHAYVGAEVTATVAVIDLADPTRPQVRSSVRDPLLDRVRALALASPTVLLASAQGCKDCVVRISVDNKRSPVILGTLSQAPASGFSARTLSPVVFTGQDAVARPLPGSNSYTEEHHAHPYAYIADAHAGALHVVDANCVRWRAAKGLGASYCASEQAQREQYMHMDGAAAGGSNNTLIEF